MSVINYMDEREYQPKLKFRNMDNKISLDDVKEECVQFALWVKNNYRYNVNNRLYRSTYELEHCDGICIYDAHDLYKQSPKSTQRKNK